MEADGLTHHGCGLVHQGVQGDGELAQIGGGVQRDIVGGQGGGACNAGRDARQVVFSRAQLGDVDHTGETGCTGVGACHDVQAIGLRSGQGQGHAVGEHDVLDLRNAQVHAGQVGAGVDVQGGVGTQIDGQCAIGVGVGAQMQFRTHCGVAEVQRPARGGGCIAIVVQCLARDGHVSHTGAGGQAEQVLIHTGDVLDVEVTAQTGSVHHRQGCTRDAVGKVLG